MQINVCDYGAVPDGIHDSTIAMQCAIDECGKAGGGRVIVPAGQFCTDMLTLRDNVELHLESGCVLLSLLKPVPEDNENYREASFNMRRWLVGGVGLRNASVTGRGIIDGRGYVNFWNMDDGYEHPLYGQRYWPGLHRPRALLHFHECTDILVEDVTLIEPPAYNIWMLGCDRCDIRGVRIRTDLHGPTNDGIDIDCCSNIYITGCDIISNDDAIGIFSDINRLGYEKPCENIIVTDCRIKAISDGVRIGYVGDGPIRRVSVSNCVFYECMIGISMMVAISPDDPRGVYIRKGPCISDVHFSNLVMEAEQAFNFQATKSPHTCPDPICGYIDKVSIRNVTATAHRGCYFGGVPESPLRSIEISQLDLTLTGEMGDEFVDRVPEPYPVWTDMPFDGIPWPFFVRHANDFRLCDSVIRWKEAVGAWRSEIVKQEDSKGDLRGVRTVDAPSSPPAVEFPLVRNASRLWFCGERQKAPQREEPHCNPVALMLRPHPCQIGQDATSLQDEIIAAKEMGCSAVIWEASIYREYYERSYCSSRYNDLCKCGDVQKFLEETNKAGLEPFLGGYASASLWRRHLSEWETERELTEHRCCLSEIAKEGNVAGYSFPLQRPPLAEYPDDWASRTKRLYTGFAQKVRELKRNCKIILPVDSENNTNMDGFAEQWLSLLADIRPDTLLFIGNPPETLSSALKNGLSCDAWLLPQRDSKYIFHI